MGFLIQDIGTHKDVPTVKLGTGDILIGGASAINLILFIPWEKQMQIGEELNPGVKMSTDELPAPAFCLEFDSFASVDVLIDALQVIKSSLVQPLAV